MSCPGYDHMVWCSDCVTLNDPDISPVGCYLRWWNGSEWIDADKGQGDCKTGMYGKFSDGTYCYTVVDGIITNRSQCLAIYVYAKWVNQMSNGELQYSINNGTTYTIGQITSSSCALFTTITTGFASEDNITFSDTDGKAVGGDSNDCPGGAYSCIYVVDPLASINYIYITVDGSLSC